MSCQGCSVARTNLECDLIQRGGSLVEGAAGGGGGSGGAAASAAASPNVAHTNKPKFCFSE